VPPQPIQVPENVIYAIQRVVAATVTVGTNSSDSVDLVGAVIGETVDMMDL
jgi:hypothetical protein